MSDTRPDEGKTPTDLQGNLSFFFQSAASQQRDFRSEFAQCLHGKGEHSPGLLCSGSNWVLKLNSHFLGISLQMLLMKF